MLPALPLPWRYDEPAPPGLHSVRLASPSDPSKSLAAALHNPGISNTYLASMLGPVDGNNFYAFCERIFNPSLRGRPVVVLSYNDGCAIARSQEAKDLGVGMGQPIHEVPPEVCRQLKVLSANFGLYGDLSGRVVSIPRDLFPQVEVTGLHDSVGPTRQGEVGAVGLAITLGTPSFCIAFA
ncbi:hypothetical protein [Xanthomonas campestris]|uniref:Y-family DNA polymerase n=1 Tax=Xanthomonas campestris TaxID=339 RepID=UPI00388E0324